MSVRGVLRHVAAGRSVRAQESGFTLIEALMAVMVLAVGIIGAFTAFVDSDHSTLTVQREQAATMIGEQTIEQLRALPYTSLALSSLPVHSTDGNATGDTSGNPANPNYWVSGANLLIPANFSQESSGTLSGVSSTGEVLISGGSVNPGPVSATADGYTASVYTYITWVDDHCIYLAVDLCPGTEDAKRITVAVVLHSGTNVGVQKPVWLSTIVANPKAGLGL